MKKLIAILLLVALCMGLVACTQSEAEPTEEPTQATQAASQVTGGGSLAPVSGNTPTLSSGSGCAGDTGGSNE